jgi:hypothetical protein
LQPLLLSYDRHSGKANIGARVLIGSEYLLARLTIGRSKNAEGQALVATVESVAGTVASLAEVLALASLAVLG